MEKKSLRILLAVIGFALVLATKMLGADPATFIVGDVIFRRPPGWQWVATTSPMRKAQLAVPAPEGVVPNTSAEVVFFYFGAEEGGGIEANTSRWIGQFSEPEDKLKPTVETAEVNGIKVTRVRVETGTFQSGMPGDPTMPQPGYGLCGAILETSHGNIFVKMVGPSQVVNAALKNFDAMIQSAATGAEASSLRSPTHE